jgi:hypothetical protein
MGEIIEINQPITRNMLKHLSEDVRIKSLSYGRFGAEIELKDELSSADGNKFIDDFKDKLIKKKDQGPPTQPPGPP